MGRPINNSHIGNVSSVGQQIAATAYFTGLGGTSAAWISSQKATNTYNMISNCGQYNNRVQLTNGGVALQPGQANITVQPYGSTGSGVVATANIGITTYAVTTGGSGSTANGYIPGQLLSVNTGTYTGNQRANAHVIAVSLGAVTVSTNNGYTVGDTFTWSAAGWYAPSVITVATTTGNGNISGVTISSAGTTVNASIGNTTTFTSSSTANAWATSAAFSLRWDVSGLAAYNTGDYTVPPSNPVSFTAQTGYGTGAAATATYGISSTHITTLGANYQAVQVAVSGNGGAIVAGTVNGGGAVSSLTVIAPGTFGPTRPTLAVTPIASTEYAEVIKNLSVTTFNYNTYEWVATGTVPGQGQAVIQTA